VSTASSSSKSVAKMYHFVTAVTTILTLSARQIEAQAVLATDCYYKLDNGIAPNPPSHPCGVVSSTSVRPSKSFTKAITDEKKNFFACCVAGDTCLDDGICHTPKPLSAPDVGSGCMSTF
jgi:hypothetical protein